MSLHRRTWVLTALMVVVLIMALAVPAFAQEGEDMCVHDYSVESLIHCVHHAYEMGHITNAGVAESLTRILGAAQSALDRDQTAVAVSLLDAFIREVEAQSGHNILAEHADHLIEHAEMVRASLG